MVYTRKNKGVCSISSTVEIEDGCEGNITGVCILAKGRPAAEVRDMLKGVTCGKKATSCPDQLSKCIDEALSK